MKRGVITRLSRLPNLSQLRLPLKFKLFHRFSLRWMLLVNFCQLSWHFNRLSSNLANSQQNLAPASAPAPIPPVVEHIFDDPIQGVTPANVDSLSTTRLPASLAKEPTMFIKKARGHVTIKEGKGFFSYMLESQASLSGRESC